ncbi:acyltransferase family protein, partial [Paenibacillus sp. YN15]|uniref:acyltransferase family protein n=1 Tax=Paenibacillus sp. YN15 TaxID=1742774 RepID=UPI000DCB82E5
GSKRTTLTSLTRQQSFCNTQVHKFKTILAPMLLINFIYIIFYVALQKTSLYSLIQNNEPINLFQRLKILFIWMGTPDFGGATWFLLVLFVIEIIFKIISDISNKLNFFGAEVLLVSLISFTGWFLINNKISLPYYFDISMFGLSFFFLGLTFRKHNIFHKNIDHKFMLPFAIIIVIFFGSFYFKGKLPMNWPTKQFPPLSIQFVSVICGIYLTFIFAKILEYSIILNKFLVYIGQHTFCILITHFFIFRLIFGFFVWVNIFPKDYLRELTPRYSPYPFWLFLTSFSLFLCALIARISRKNRILNYIFNAR